MAKGEKSLTNGQNRTLAVECVVVTLKTLPVNGLMLLASEKCINLLAPHKLVFTIVNGLSEKCRCLGHCPK